MAMWQQSAVELAERVRSGSSTAREVAEQHLTHAQAVEPSVKSFLELNADHIRSQADAVDQKRASGKPLGKLAGVPVGIKDLICIKGSTTTCASQILKNFVPPYDAHVIERLRAEDALLFGKLNMDEFAMGSSCENSSYQKTHNPWNLAYVPGGSSGGSAAAVAARQAPLTLGTDTGGSIRQPAALCGITGLKPTYGRVSRYGLIAFASSLDQIGPMGRSAEDCALLLSVLAGHDQRDSTSLDEAVPDYLSAIKQPLKGKRIGIVEEYFGAGLDAQVSDLVKAGIKQLESLGATTCTVHLPHAKYAIPTYYLVATAEASSNLARYDGVHYGHRAKQFSDMIDMFSRSRAEGFGTEVKRRIMLGTFALSSGYRDAYYIKALKVRRLIRQDFDQAFAQCDAVIGPATPSAGFKIGEKTEDPLAMYLSDIYTVSTNLAGLPGLSMPCGFTKSGLPVGLQLQGKILDEATILQIAHQYQQATNWHQQLPGICQ